VTKPNERRHWTEAERLAALWRTGLLDTAPEQAYDDIVRLAADLIGVPMAAVHLVAENRQWSKAEIGLGVRDIPRDIAFCPLAMLEQEGLVVPDATKDPRFANNPLVTGGPGIRFYAGVPLEAEGLPVGALCVIDTKPREGGLDERQRFALKTLASQVSSQFALRRAVAQRDELLAEQALAAVLQQQTLNSVTDYAIISMDLQGRATGWNTGAELVLGWTEQEMLGQTIERFFTPEDRAEDRMEVEMRCALETGRGNDERWHLHKDGHRFWANGAMMPLRAETGEVVGFVKVLRDRTEQHRSMEALSHAESALRRAQEAGRVGVFSVGVEDGILHATPEFCRLYGIEECANRASEDFECLVIPEDAALVSRASTRRRGEAPTDVRYRIRRADTGELRWIARRGEFEHDADGRTVRFVGVAQDVTEECAARDALRKSEERWRGLFERMHEGLALCEIVYGSDGAAADFRYLEVNAAWERLTGVPPTEIVGRLASEAIPGIERFWTDTYARVAETGEPAHFEYYLAALGRWFEVLAYQTEPGRFAAVFLNISERKRQEEMQALMSREVDHRAKNALAVVQAAIRLTKAPDLPSYARIIEGRVGALARAQTLLADDRWAGADLRSLLRGELAGFLDSAGGSQARLVGAAVTLPAGAAQPLAMAIHELATNAVKYGALSVPEGFVTVSWTLEGDLPGMLHLRWAETGGPPVTGVPERRGFGSRVLTGTVRRQLSGTVSLAWETAGLVCVMEVPLDPGREPEAVISAALR
jgi:PAS domain S-box-containing protein